MLCRRHKKERADTGTAGLQRDLVSAENNSSQLPHPADSAGIGTMAGVGNMRKTEQKNTYIFYVKKEDEEQARNLIKEA